MRIYPSDLRYQVLIIRDPHVFENPSQCPQCQPTPWAKPPSIWPCYEIAEEVGRCKDKIHAIFCMMARMIDICFQDNDYKSVVVVRDLVTDDVVLRANRKEPTPLVVYVAGPIGNGKVHTECDPEVVKKNQANAYAAASDLMALGFAPITPHASIDWPFSDRPPHGTWIMIDKAIVSKCDVLVRLPGDSVGADEEVAHARRRGIPVLTLEQVTTTESLWKKISGGLS